MTFEDARAAIYGRLHTAWSVAHPGMPVRYENRMVVDLGKEQDPFITCEILFTDGEQLGMGDDPGVRYEGAIYLSVWVKEDSGTAEAFAYLAELADLFQMAVFQGVKTRAARPLPGQLRTGWYVLILRVPMWFDQI